MTCTHPNVKLYISWTVETFTQGPDVIGSQVEEHSLKVVANCPNCGQSGKVFTTTGDWRVRWPTWLCNRVRQLASDNVGLRQAVQRCMPGLIEV
jgi:hypothetical protein